jgi:hypothetical protein
MILQAAVKDKRPLTSYNVTIMIIIMFIIILHATNCGPNDILWQWAGGKMYRGRISLNVMG